MPAMTRPPDRPPTEAAHPEWFRAPTRRELKMGAGELKVEGGSAKLMEADFTYNIPSWKPVVRYDSSSFRGQLTIEQPRGSHGGSHMTYKWDIRLNDKIPLDIVTHLGAGEARMALP